MRERTIDLGYRPRAWQRECHLKLKRFSVLALHRRAGKTEMALRQLIDRALRCERDLGMFVYVAPYLKQAKAIAWARMKQIVAPLIQFGAVEINEGDTSVRFPANGAIIRCFGADNPDALRGLRLDGAVIDEVAQVKPELWIDVIQPALADRKGWCLFIGTPSGINLFSELFYKAMADTSGDWFAARYTVDDTEALERDEVERMRRDMADQVFAREMLCDFSAAGDNQLISLADAEDASRRLYKPGEMDYAPRILGVDPARFGDDRSVIFPRQGLQTFDPMVYRGIDNMQLAAHVAAKIESWQPDAVFIDAGAGSGVIDRLRQLGHDVIEVDFGGKASDPRFVNRRTEMWHLLGEAIAAGLAIPNHTGLKQELATPTYSYDAANRIKLESKDEIKKRLAGGASPDLADALALTYASPVGKRRIPPGRETHPLAYDPIAEVSTFHSSAARDYDPLTFAR